MKIKIGNLVQTISIGVKGTCRYECSKYGELKVRQKDKSWRLVVGLCC